EDYNQLRPLSYPNTDVFLICFSVVNPASYHNVQEEWVPELKVCMPNVPYVLIGTQIDLRDDPKTLARLLYMKEKPLTYEHGVKLAKEVTTFWSPMKSIDLSIGFHSFKANSQQGSLVVPSQVPNTLEVETDFGSWAHCFAATPNLPPGKAIVGKGATKLLLLTTSARSNYELPLWHPHTKSTPFTSSPSRQKHSSSGSSSWGAYTAKKS
ncbi:hypothetical protein CIB84_015152, partial [Bambusicola thoracicus]